MILETNGYRLETVEDMNLRITNIVDGEYMIIPGHVVGQLIVFWDLFKTSIIQLELSDRNLYSWLNIELLKKTQLII